MFAEFQSIPDWVLTAAHSILALSMALAGWRIWKGPSVQDRVVALDLLAALIMGQVALSVVDSGFVSYLDVATAIAIITFLATIAFARYLENKDAPL
jgi:multicomponent Na+:H+ antiporter subunit F